MKFIRKTAKFIVLSALLISSGFCYAAKEFNKRLCPIPAITQIPQIPLAMTTYISNNQLALPPPTCEPKKKIAEIDGVKQKSSFSSHSVVDIIITSQAQPEKIILLPMDSIILLPSNINVNAGINVALDQPANPVIDTPAENNSVVPSTNPEVPADVTVEPPATNPVIPIDVIEEPPAETPIGNADNPPNNGDNGVIHGNKPEDKENNGDNGVIHGNKPEDKEKKEKDEKTNNANIKSEVSISHQMPNKASQEATIVVEPVGNSVEVKEIKKDIHGHVTTEIKSPAAEIPVNASAESTVAIKDQKDDKKSFKKQKQNGNAAVNLPPTTLNPSSIVGKDKAQEIKANVGNINAPDSKANNGNNKAQNIKAKP